MAPGNETLPESVKHLRQALAERRALRDSDAGVAFSFRLFMAIEVMIRELCEARDLEPRNPGMFQMIEALGKAKVIPERLMPSLHNLRVVRNMAAHATPGFELKNEDLDVLETQAQILFAWYLADSPDGPHISRGEVQRVFFIAEPPKSSPPRKRVFLCYAKEDYEKVEKLYIILENRGHQPWMDKKNLLPGQNWEVEITRSIEKADFFIACMSKQSVTKRGYVQKEVRFALDVLGEIPHGQIFLIPLRLEPCDVPRPLSSLHWIDLDSSDFPDLLYRSLESSV